MNTKKIITAAMLSAVTLAATIMIRIPSPLGGYINLGDAAVLLSGYLLSPLVAFAAAGIGSALADLFSGYALYAPATFLIKGAMALIFSSITRKSTAPSRQILASIPSEIFMVSGYYCFEGLIYGFGASLVNIPPNTVQAVAGAVIGIILMRIFERYKIIK